jgi:hypothetical protein
MTSVIDHTIAHRLAHLRPTLLPQVTDQIAASIPIVGIDPKAEDQFALHHRNMQTTTERFHDLVQVWIDTDWSLLNFEYSWAARVFRPMGITWAHQVSLIDAYFTTARRLEHWNAEELAELDTLAERLRVDGEHAYNA